MIGGFTTATLSCVFGFFATSAAMEEQSSYQLYIILSLVIALLGILLGGLLAKKKQRLFGVLLIFLNIIMPFIGIVIPLAQSMREAFG